MDMVNLEPLAASNYLPTVFLDGSTSNLHVVDDFMNHDQEFCCLSSSFLLEFCLFNGFNVHSYKCTV
ncbi:unnamed protein product [Urochloa humidicola]